jgi:hypothetical protein
MTDAQGENQLSTPQRESSVAITVVLTGMARGR